jgi:hypothetical protein
MTRKLELTVSLLFTKGTGKAKTVTIAMFKDGGNNLLATSNKMVGRYTEEQAIREYRSNPKRFKVTPLGADLLPVLV